jgi:integrase
MPSIRKRNDKWQVQVRIKDAPPVSKSFTLKQDAERWAREMEAQAQRGALPVNRKALDGMTLGCLVRRYKREVVPSKKGVEIERIILDAFLRHPICQKKLSNLTPADFAAYRDQRLGEITAKSLKRQLSPIHNMFEVARDEWGLPLRENPLDKVKLKAVDNRRERRLKEGELERIFEAAKSRKNPYIIPIILFALETAMRRGEILALRWDDVDLKRSCVTVREAKNGYSRTIPLTPAACALVRGIPGERESKQRVFPTSANAVRLSWQRITKRAGIEDLHFHDLRHEAISRFFELGLTVPEVASISGHRDARMLLRYAHANVASIGHKLSLSASENTRNRLARGWG